jgi:predicted DNA-binding protein (MmcQ/YjbR family)
VGEDGVVAHPRTYSERDPHLAELRKAALSLPESAEVEAWGRPTFRAGKKMFAMFVHQDGHGFAVAFKPDAEDRPALVADGRRFYSPPYLGPGGWLALDLDAAPVDWDEVAELLEASYRQVALKRMLKSLDER